MRSVVEGATPSRSVCRRPLHRVPPSPSPAARVRSWPPLAALPRYFSRLVVVLGVCTASACSTGSRQPVTAISVDAGRTASLVSSYRAQNGLGPVSVDSRLMQAAAAQARAMGERDKIGHKVAGALSRRVSATGYDWGATAENLGAGYPSLEAAMQGWKNSAGHRRNLVNPLVTEIGIAAVATPPGSEHRTYWALILAGPRPEPSAAGPYAMTRQ